jgi:photosynthetic reaction center M subunit
LRPGSRSRAATDERIGRPFYNWIAGCSATPRSVRSIWAFWAQPRSICGAIWFVIIGFNMLASVGWDPFQFIRQLFWLALEPPPRNTASILAAAQRRRLVHHRRQRLPAGLGAAVVGEDVCRARALGLGTHVLGLRAAIWLFLVLGLSSGRC